MAKITKKKLLRGGAEANKPEAKSEAKSEAKPEAEAKPESKKSDNKPNKNNKGDNKTKKKGMLGKLKKGAKDRGNKFRTDKQELRGMGDLVKVFNEGKFNQYVKEDEEYKKLLIDLTNNYCSETESKGDNKNEITNNNRKQETKEESKVKGIKDMKLCVENYRLLGEEKGGMLFLLKYIDNPDDANSGSEFLKNTLLHADSLKKMPSALKDLLQKSLNMLYDKNVDLNKFNPKDFVDNCKKVEDNFQKNASFKSEGAPLTVKEKMYLEIEEVIKIKKLQRNEIDSKKKEQKLKDREERKGGSFIWIVIGCVVCATALTPRDMQSRRGGLLSGSYSRG